MSKTHSTSVRGMVSTAIMAAMICIAAPFAIPMPGLVPISLATLAVYLAGALLGAKKGTAAVAVYILIGAVGLPVYSGFTAGLGVLFGITGGYLLGYIPCALICGLFADGLPKKSAALPLGMALGTLVCYIFGTAWFMLFTGQGAAEALAVCVVPFLAGDVVKIVCASALAYPLRAKLHRAALCGERK